MEKVIRNGNVAVLYSPGYGAGWYTWHGIRELLFHPVLVKMVEEGRQKEITESLCQDITGRPKGEYICVLGAPSLRIGWIPEGTAFKVNEYDGAESIETLDSLTLTA